MGIYINKGNEGFRRARRSKYVDKSMLISLVNESLDTERSLSCVTRGRRFGKTMAADMLYAYYDKSCQSRTLFDGLAIQQHPSFEEHLNRYPVIKLDVTDFTTRYRESHDIVRHIQQEILADVAEAYPDIPVKESDDLMAYLIRIQQQRQEKFIMIIDEWDAICREFSPHTKPMDEYVDFLRRLFKGNCSKEVFAGAYMTGILPIKKYTTESALNNFREYSVVISGPMAPYFGFSPKEVAQLAENSKVTIDELKEWYDGYQIGNETSVYNPYAVMEAIYRGACANFWTSTGAYDAVASYIKMNFEGLKDDIVKMLAGGRCKVNATKFNNDMAVIRSKDDVLTVLIHLGYLSYNSKKNECYIPNKEVSLEMSNAVENTGWKRLYEALAASEQLLADTLQGDAEAVARGIDLAHDEHTSILSYNNENSLACVLSIAYYYAQNDYLIQRELPTGKGFADLVCIPRREVDSPALVIELKYNQSADSAIDQIHCKAYPAKVAAYTGALLLVGINYDKATKTHTCRIETYQKDWFS